MRALVILTAILASACTATYTVPQEQAPLAWSGSAGFEAVADTMQVFEGDHRSGDVLLRWQVEHVRTGRLAQDAVYGTPGREQFVLPANTRVYAMQFSVEEVHRYARTEIGRYNLNADNNPIEWCAVPTNGPVICVFWEGPEQARYIEAARTLPLVASLRTAAGWPGAVPVVREEAVDFTTPLLIEIRVGRVREHDVQLEAVITDGEGRQSFPSSILAPLLAWDEAGEARAHFFDGELRLQSRRTDTREYGALTMSVVTPLRDPGARKTRRDQADPQAGGVILTQAFDTRPAGSSDGLGKPGDLRQTVGE
jgi:hypothetical protein